MVTIYTTTFQQTVEHISAEDISPAGQSTVKNYLNGLRISALITKDIKVSEALPSV